MKFQANGKHSIYFGNAVHREYVFHDMKENIQQKSQKLMEFLINNTGKFTMAEIWARIIITNVIVHRMHHYFSCTF